MYLNAEQPMVYNLISDLQCYAYDQSLLNVITALQPKFTIEDHFYCYTYGEKPNNYIQGRGETAYDAMKDFVNKFINLKIN